MYELVQVGVHSYYMDCPSKVGLVRIGNQEVVLIDSGSDKDAAKKVKKILDEQGWTLKAIFNTHSHADHIGGNQYLQGLTGCPIYAPSIEAAVTQFPILEPTMLYGGFAMKELHNEFLMAKESYVQLLTKEVLPEGMELLPLPGHSYDMVGFLTQDRVAYLADCLSSEETLQKYKIGFLYDVEASLNTLQEIQTIKAGCFVSAHAPTLENVEDLAQKNILNIQGVALQIKSLLGEGKTFENLLTEIFDTNELSMSLQQNVLLGSTVKSYLSYLKNRGEVMYFFENNQMLWKAQ